MSIAPDPEEIFERAVEEGDRRLEQSLLEMTSTAFIAGFTIVFGLVALGLVESYVAGSGGLSHLAGSLAFGVGLVFLIVGRTELFSENFFDPVAAAFDRDDSWMVGPLLRLWTVTFAINLVGGAMFALIFSYDGVLPTGAREALARFAEELVHRPAPTEFASGIVGGALVTLLSYMLEAVNSVGSRIAMAYLVGVLLAIGPFDHVIVTVLHAFFGVLFTRTVTYTELVHTLVIVTAGNLVGGLGLVTVTHIAQFVGAEES